MMMNEIGLRRKARGGSAKAPNSGQRQFSACRKSDPDITGVAWSAFGALSGAPSCCWLSRRPYGFQPRRLKASA
jgi:hypothetical protein